MRKIVLIIVCAYLASSCSSFPKNIRNTAYRYTGKYTGIDTLINIEGHYSSKIFYDNGLVVNEGALIHSYNGVRFQDNAAVFLRGIAENPDAKDSKDFYNMFDCGRYIICGDTIKVQELHKPYSFNDYWSGYETWYKIIDRNTLQAINFFPLTASKDEKEHFEKQFSNGGAIWNFEPVPVKPNPDYFWILREKWFWCNEQDWKDYMEKIKQKKKEIKLKNN